MTSRSSMPMVSVVIPAYNAGLWIRDTLESVFSQTYRDFEVIVVDDGSSDDTPAVVSGYGREVRYLRQENGGSPSARNVAIRAATGRYVAFLDADDLWAPEKLERQMDVFRTAPDTAWVYSDAWVISDTTRPCRIGLATRLHSGDILRPLLLHDFIPSPTVVVRKEVFEVVGVFDEAQVLRAVEGSRRSVFEDWDMWLRIAARYPVTLVGDPLAYYRKHSSGNSFVTPSHIRLESLLAVIERAILREPIRLSDLRERALANVFVGVAGRAVALGDLREAKRLLQPAIRLCPADWKLYLYWLGIRLPWSLVTPVLSMRRLVRSFVRGAKAMVLP